MSLPLGDRAFFSIDETNIASERSAAGGYLSSDAKDRNRQTSITQKLIRRKQISRDLYSAQAMDFFEDPLEGTEDEDLDVAEFENSLFFPLRFPPPMKPKAGGGGHGHGGGGHGIQGEQWRDDEGQLQAPDDDRVVRATRSDYIKTAVLFLLMSAFTGVCVGWKTHEDKNNSIFGYVGRSCVTPCNGDVTYRDFFTAKHNYFGSGDVSLVQYHTAFVTHHAR